MLRTVQSLVRLPLRSLASAQPPCTSIFKAAAIATGTSTALSDIMARGNRKTSTAAAASASIPNEPPTSMDKAKGAAALRRTRSSIAKAAVDPDKQPDIQDGAEALRASPDAAPRPSNSAKPKAGMKRKRTAAVPAPTPSLVEDAGSDSPLSDLPDIEPPQDEVSTEKKGTKRKKATNSASKKASAVDPKIVDPEAVGDEPASADEVKAALERPPPVNSDYLPLPWKGRLGYACLNTYLRNSNPPVFSSRTCRIASILEHRHPLQNPDEPPHATKNRPDKDKPPSVERGMAWVQALGLANARDIVKMLKWNDKYGIKFLRLSSEMFPFASHEEYGYKLAPFASEALADAGKVAAKLGHRLTTHPGQFTQLGSPRRVVIVNAIRDLEYHAEMLSLLKLPPQQDRDAVMILHLGGVFGDKEATLDRFRTNYAKLSPEIKKRLVLENDDVSWCVHELLPICEELNIPFVLDFHHHNIVFDDKQIREGTKDIMELFPRILQTWKRKNITPKMHYSEPTESAITPRQRRKHSPRVARLPPCPSDMDLMIEAKDKEQAVFELMRTFKLPGHDSFHEMTPHVRLDDNKALKRPKKVKEGEEEVVPIPEHEVGMGGASGQVYWPLGKEEWLRPVKKVVKKKAPEEDEAALDEETPKPAKAKKPKPKPQEAKSDTEKSAPTKKNARVKRAEDVETAEKSEELQGAAEAKPSKKRKITSKPEQAASPGQPASAEQAAKPKQAAKSEKTAKSEKIAKPEQTAKPAARSKKSTKTPDRTGATQATRTSARSRKSK